MSMTNINRKVFFYFIGLVLFLFSQANAQEMTVANGFSITRLMVAESVENHEPVRPDSTFSSQVMKVYCFLEAQNISELTPIIMVWSYEGRETARVELLLGQGPRWRTFSSKNIFNRRGAWNVAIMDTNGKSYAAVDFTVE